MFVMTQMSDDERLEENGKRNYSEDVLCELFV